MTNYRFMQVNRSILQYFPPSLNYPLSFDMRFPTMRDVCQQSLRPACACTQSDQSLCKSLEHSMTVKLLAEHHLEFLSLKKGCTGSSESTLVKMAHCWKSHAAAHLSLRSLFCLFLSGQLRQVVCIWRLRPKFRPLALLETFAYNNQLVKTCHTLEWSIFYWRSAVAQW